MICFHSLNYWYLQQLCFLIPLAGRVVICFHSLNYWYLQQRKHLHQVLVTGCDLLSFFELLIFTTTLICWTRGVYLLWFAFILWTTDIYNNRKRRGQGWSKVVICFHSLNYWYLQQLTYAGYFSKTCCDLLSFFELLIFTTTQNIPIIHSYKLWFAFILWTTDIYNNWLGFCWQ